MPLISTAERQNAIGLVRAATEFAVKLQSSSRHSRTETRCAVHHRVPRVRQPRAPRPPEPMPPGRGLSKTSTTGSCCAPAASASVVAIRSIASSQLREFDEGETGKVEHLYRRPDKKLQTGQSLVRETNPLPVVWSAMFAQPRAATVPAAEASRRRTETSGSALSIPSVALVSATSPSCSTRYPPASRHVSGSSAMDIVNYHNSLPTAPPEISRYSE